MLSDDSLHADAARHAESVEQIARSLIRQANSNRDQSLSDAVAAFVAAVDWRNERWLWALGAAHVLLLAMVIATRRWWAAQVYFLCFVCTWAFSFELVHGISILFLVLRALIVFFLCSA
jgi:hypothetical protein